ncbi:MAG: hypothetical protein ABS938_07775, partial [Psychrobacillus psychrodurans]
MKKKFLNKFFSAFMVLAMIFTMLSPAMTASANSGVKPFKQNTPSESTMQLKSAVAEQLNL